MWTAHDIYANRALHRKVFISLQHRIDQALGEPLISLALPSGSSPSPDSDASKRLPSIPSLLLIGMGSSLSNIDFVPAIQISFNQHHFLMLRAEWKLKHVLHQISPLTSQLCFLTSEIPTSLGEVCAPPRCGRPHILKTQCVGQGNLGTLEPLAAS